MFFRKLKLLIIKMQSSNDDEELEQVPELRCNERLIISVIKSGGRKPRSVAIIIMDANRRYAVKNH